MKEYNLTSNWRNFVMSKWDSKGTGIIHLKGINKYNLISNDSWCTFTPAVFVKLAFETFKLDVYRKTKQKNKTKQNKNKQTKKQNRPTLLTSREKTTLWLYWYYFQMLCDGQRSYLENCFPYLVLFSLWWFQLYHKRIFQRGKDSRSKWPFCFGEIKA